MIAIMRSSIVSVDVFGVSMESEKVAHRGWAVTQGPRDYHSNMQLQLQHVHPDRAD